MQCDAIDTEPDDLLLFDAFRISGDREALLRLFQRHSDAAFRLALRLSGDVADAEDAVQEGFIALITTAHRYRGEGSVRSWILSIVANSQRRQARATMRRKRRERSAPDLRLAATPRVDDQQERAAVLASLAELPKLYRMPIAMRYLDDLEFSDITAALGIKEKTVRSQVSRGLELMRDLLRQRGVALSALAMTGLLTKASAATSLGLQANLRHIASTTQPTTATIGVRMIGMTLGALGTAVAVAWTIVGLNLPAEHLPESTSLSMASTEIAEPTLHEGRIVSHTLDSSGRFGFHQCSPDDIARRLMDRLPRDQRIPIGFPTRSGRCITYEKGRADIQFGDHRVRDALDSVAAQCGLTLYANRVGAVLHRRLPDAQRAALLASFDQANAEQIAEAAKALAASGDLTVIKRLLLALAEDAERSVAAAVALRDFIPSSWDSIHLPESLLLGLADDHDCCASVLTALGHADLPTTTRDTIVRVAGHLRIVEAGDLLLPLARNYANACRETYHSTRGTDLFSANLVVGRAAVDALGFLGVAAGPTLAGLLDPELGSGNDCICQALGRMRCQEAVQPLLELNRLLWASTDPRAFSCTHDHLIALAWIGDDAAIPPLVRIASGI